MYAQRSMFSFSANSLVLCSQNNLPQLFQLTCEQEKKRCIASPEAMHDES
jgi:hypothetical protein